MFTWFDILLICNNYFYLCCRLLLRQLPWHFAVGEEGKVVAILQDTVLEIRTSRDEYSSVVGKASSK